MFPRTSFRARIGSYGIHRLDRLSDTSSRLAFHKLANTEESIAAPLERLKGYFAVRGLKRGWRSDEEEVAFKPVRIFQRQDMSHGNSLLDHLDRQSRDNFMSAVRRDAAMIALIVRALPAIRSSGLG